MVVGTLIKMWHCPSSDSMGSRTLAVRSIAKLSWWRLRGEPHSNRGPRHTMVQVQCTWRNGARTVTSTLMAVPLWWWLCRCFIRWVRLSVVCWLLFLLLPPFIEFAITVTTLIMFARYGLGRTGLEEWVSCPIGIQNSEILPAFLVNKWR